MKWRNVFLLLVPVLLIALLVIHFTTDSSHDGSAGGYPPPGNPVMGGATPVHSGLARLRLKDIAQIEDGEENIYQSAWANHQPAIVISIQRQPGTNVISVVDDIKAQLPALQAALPDGMKVQILSERTQTIRASISDVQFERMLSIALVVMVTFLFLRNVAATLIPSVAVPLSLIGTFGVMYLCDFSLRIMDQQIALYEQSVRAYERYLKINENKYQAGMIDYLDVATTQNTSLTQQQNLLSLLSTQRLTSVKLIVALGGGWQTAAASR